MATMAYLMMRITKRTIKTDIDEHAACCMRGLWESVTRHTSGIANGVVFCVALDGWLRHTYPESCVDFGAFGHYATCLQTVFLMVNALRGGWDGA
jgi:hypothetical protein